jgi:hypothetical protein
VRGLVPLNRETSQESCPIGSGERGGNQGRDLKSRMGTLQVDSSYSRLPRRLVCEKSTLVSILGYPGTAPDPEPHKGPACHQCNRNYTKAVGGKVDRAAHRAVG